MWLRLWSLCGFFAMAGGLVTLFASDNLISLNPTVVLAQTAALVLALWARYSLGRRSFHLTAEPTQGTLVTTGPYRIIRHPIYTAACLFVWPGALAHHSLPAFTLTAMVTVGAVIRMLCEEHLLAKHFPEYMGYAHVTKRMIPYVV
jgi:protein-S-isoprenylcysteine O-methyltransferase Ste14